MADDEERILTRFDGSPGHGNGAVLDVAVRQAVRERASPEGIVTILFTDIVESTRLRQVLGDDAAQKRFRQHNEVVRSQIHQHGGFEVKTQGDSFMVAFGDVAAAVECAMAIQRAVAEDNRMLPRQELRVRMGLNCGQAIKEEEDFFGGAVVVAARLASRAKGGEIFVSATVRGLTGLRPDIQFVRRGAHHLKGLDGTYDVWAVHWQEGAPKRFALPAGPLFRIGLPIALLLLVGGGTVAGFVVNGAAGGGNNAGVVYRDIATDIDIRASVLTISGDCKSSDLFVTASIEGQVTGGITGSAAGSTDATLYAADGCGRTKAKSLLTLTDSDGSSLSLVALSQSINRSTGLTNGTGASSQFDRAASIITGGTGKYAGITGRGVCTILAYISQNVPGSADSTARATANCTHQIALAAEAEPIIVQAATSVETMTVVGHSTDLPYEARVTVLYRNDRDEPQKGLSLRVPVPQGAQLKMTEIGESGGGAPTTSAQAWQLPDLAPGAVGEFEFVVQVLSTKESSISLVPEITGQGLAAPVRSGAVTIKVVQ